MALPVQPSQSLNISQSNQIVKVKAIDTTTRMVCDAKAFVQPPIEGHDKLNLKTMCFLIEHETPTKTHRVLFDCGSRKDFWNGSPKSQSMIGGHVPSVQVDYGVDEILVSKGFDLQDLDAIVWSHWHWDHIGDGSKFNASTDIVVGPGFTRLFVPGWPTNSDSFVLDSDLQGHRIHEPEFDLVVAGFAAHDYFGDGSFYLLDVPGHAEGHICGLARTTSQTMVFLGGDCCHFPGAFRPTPYIPLPAEIPSEYLDSFYPRPCPCSIFTTHHPASQKDETSSSFKSRTQPFYQISDAPGTAYSVAGLAQKSVDQLQHLDADPNVFICLAHDDILFSLLPLFNHDSTASINDWQIQNYKEKSRWSFLNEFPKGDKPGREPLVIGKWRDGKKITWKEGIGFTVIE